jgi:hypothetical protein
MQAVSTYQIIDDTPVISINQWMEAGLSYNQFRVDSRSGYLKIHRRGLNGETLIDVTSIRNPDRRAVLEKALGEIGRVPNPSIYKVEIDTEARDFYICFRLPDGEPLPKEKITEYTHRACVFNALGAGMRRQIEARARLGKKLKLSEFWRERLRWHTEQAIEYNIPVFSNERSLERAFKEYLKDGYKAIIHKNFCNDSARVVSTSAEKLMLALWRVHDKPFISEVHRLYLEFVSGAKELFDKETGEIFRPEDFRYVPREGGESRALEVSEATVRLYLKDVVNETAVYADRNGNFDYVNSRRPKHHRKLGQFSLSKVSADDVALSRKSVRGWVYKYIMVDVVSGYWFRPAYVIGKPSLDTVYEAFRNMFCELSSLGLPIPGELEVEYHLMKDIHWLEELFPFVRFCESPTEKRAEHAIKALKYGAAKEAGHTRGRWYAKHEAYLSIRNKQDGDFVEPECQPQMIIADDLADIEKHNDGLHPLQKTYRGKTRRQVFLENINKSLKPIEHWHLYRFIGNQTETSIRNNDYCAVANTEFELADFNSLKRLKPNNLEVTAYWLPDDDGSIGKVYLYQGETYIGEAVNRAKFAYNENAIERGDEDAANMLHQEKRLAKFDKFIKDRKNAIFKIGKLDGGASAAIAAVPVEIVETVQPKGLDEYAFEKTNYSELAVRSL